MFGITDKILNVALIAATFAAASTAGLYFVRMTKAQSDLAQLTAQVERHRAETSALIDKEVTLARAEEQRRFTQQIEVQQHAIQSLQAARDDARAAVASAGSLRQRAVALASDCRGAARDPDVVAAGPAAPGPGDLLADVLGRVEEAGRQLAAVADERGIAGAVCQASYDTLTKKEPHEKQL